MANQPVFDGGLLGVATAGGGGPLGEELAAAVLAAAAELGLEGRRLESVADRVPLAALLAIGGERALVKALGAPGRGRRVVWSGEALPPPGQARSRVPAALRARLFETGQRALGRVPPGRLRDLARRLGRPVAELELWSHLEAAVRLARQSDVLVVTSRDSAAVLAKAGISAEVVPYGHSPAQHGPLQAGGDRDISALVLGGYSGPRSHRRRRWVEHWRDQGLAVELAEGAWGGARNALLRRTRVVLEVHRFPGTFVGLRLVMALAAGAVVVSEPMADPYPFVPGVHFVEAPAERLALESQSLLADEPRRRRIVAAGQALLRDELTMARSLARVLSLLHRPLPDDGPARPAWPRLVTHRAGR